MPSSITLPPQAWMTSNESRSVMSALHQQQGQARFVGGCVRDALLGRPVYDIDIACTHPPEKSMALLEEAGIRTFPTGIAHGTITALCDNKNRYEITTLRRDVACDGRHAEVAFTTNWKEDASRRDFTMNALYATPDGEITDYFGGLDDARKGIVRFIGDARLRITEDALRILRFFRFFAYYGSPPFDEASLSACREMAKAVENLAGERIQAEMLKILAAEHPADILAAMHNAGILKHLRLSISNTALAALDLLPQIEMDSHQAIDAVRRLALVLRATTQPLESVKNIAALWRLSTTMRDTLTALVEPNLTEMICWNQAAQKRMIRRLGSANYIHCVLIAWAEFLEKNSAKQQEARAHFKPILSLADDWVIPEFPLRGRDLMALGTAEGPAIGRVLAELENYWEEHDYAPNHAELINLASGRLKQKT